MLPPPDATPEPRLGVALVSDTYHPTPNGVTGVVALLAAGLSARGHRVTIVAPRFPPRAAQRIGLRPAPARAELGATPAIDLAVRSWPLLPGVAVRLAVVSPRRLARWLHDAGVEVVHTHTEGPLGVAAGAAAARLGRPRVHTLHTFYAHYLHYLGVPPAWRDRGGEVLGAALRWQLRGTRAVIAPSPAAAAQLRALAPGAVCYLVPNAVPAAPPADAGLRRQVCTRLALTATDRVVVSVGRVAEEKRSRQLLRAFVPALHADPRLRLVMVGAGGLLAELRREAAHRGVSAAVRLPGPLPHPQVTALLERADVFVSASRSENHPLSQLEAARAGCPVVTLAEPGVDDDAALVRATLARLAVAPGAVGRRRPAPGPGFTDHLDATVACYLDALAAG